ncbi:hypothetical protein [uncultured Agrococcus sp.]|uniref:Asp23/Gls24 family envelope stress response protein n=1 Tax=uncultured Agrococcus sp. TaxID=382258 RepID=UPI0025EFA8F0|nr:hypothetical protein [uncultured Agrococcus sp.]
MNDNHTPRNEHEHVLQEDLDGHTIEELTDYLESGRNPVNPSIEDSPACQRALEGLARLRTLTSTALEEEARSEPDVEEHWLRGVVSSIVAESRVGRRIPISDPDPSADLAITEGAVRGLVRGAEEAVPGVIVGKCRFLGAVEEPGAEIRISLEVSVLYGLPMHSLVTALRREVAKRIEQHSELQLEAVDIRVSDVVTRAKEEERP